jgi:hypothetical protein
MRCHVHGHGLDWCSDAFVWWLLVQVISLPNGARSLPPQLVKMLERLVLDHRPFPDAVDHF